MRALVAGCRSFGATGGRVKKMSKAEKKDLNPVPYTLIWAKHAHYPEVGGGGLPAPTSEQHGWRVVFCFFIFTPEANEANLTSTETAPVPAKPEWKYLHTPQGNTCRGRGGTKAAAAPASDGFFSLPPPLRSVLFE